MLDETGLAGPVTAAELRAQVREFLAAHDPAATERMEFVRARFDAGLAWVHYPAGLGGQGQPRTLQKVVDAEFAAAGAPTNRPERNGIGLGMAAPTILAYGSDEQKRRWLRPLWTGEEIWCQLFSEPGAGSDLANLATRAVRDEFNEVFLTDVVIPDADRIGEVGQGWAVATATLNNERVALGAFTFPREGGMIGVSAATWREHPELRTPGLHDKLLRLWAAAEVSRLAGERLRQQLAAGQPGPEGAGAKLVFARLNQEIADLEVELQGTDGLRYGDWTMRRPDGADFFGRDAGYRFLRSKGNSIEGGTSEILRNIVAERVLGLPPEIRLDKDKPWKDLPR